MSKIKKYEIWGAIFTIIMGSLLHFVFNWFGQNKIVALVAAVNESSWEHLKLAFWPTFIFAIFEWFTFGKTTKNFCFATMVKLIFMPILIIVLFYGWLAFFPDNFLWDISIFIVAVIIGYLLSYVILKQKKSLNLEIVSAVIITLTLISFSTLTYFPLKNFLFLDPIHGTYGINKTKNPSNQNSNNTINIDSSYNNKNISVNINDKIIVTLNDPGDGGYQFADPEYNKSILDMIDYQKQKSTLNRVGDFGNDQWTFVARQTGTTNLTYQIYRPWEKDKLQNIFTIMIVVK